MSCRSGFRRVLAWFRVVPQTGVVVEVRVIHEGWGECFCLGLLSDKGSELSFVFSQEAREKGVDLAPLRTPLNGPDRPHFPAFLDHLPGLLSDSLPDGWGRLLLARLLGGAPDALSMLAWLGRRTMGALSFECDEALPHRMESCSLQALVVASEDFQQGSDTDLLAPLALSGAGFHGARPKLCATRTQAGAFHTGDDAVGEPWLVKFCQHDEDADVCRLEVFYADMARAAGIDMMPVQLLELAQGRSAFATQRFDRHQGWRVPVHTAAGLLEADFRTVGAMGYRELLTLTRALTGSSADVHQVFARCVFNVLMHNQDDHPKNHAFMQTRNREWRITPAYDLTFSRGPYGEHCLDVLGKGREIGRKDLMALAALVDIERPVAGDIIARVADATSTAVARLRDLPLAGERARLVASRLADVRRRF